MSNTGWYYTRDNSQVGPVPLEELEALIQKGALGKGDMVWTQGMAQWTPAGQVETLAFPEVLDLPLVPSVPSLKPAPPQKGPPLESWDALPMPLAASREPQEPAKSVSEKRRSLAGLGGGKLDGRHFVGSVVGGLFLAWMLFDPLLVPGEGSEVLRWLLRLLALVLSCALAFLPVGRWLHGHWPLGDRLETLLGTRESGRRLAILGSGVGLLIYLVFFLPGSGQVESSSQAVGMAFFSLGFSLAVGLLTVGRALRGEWPLIGKWARRMPKGELADYMTPSQQHLFYSALVALVLVLLSLLKSVGEMSGEQLLDLGHEDLREVIWSWVFLAVLAYFPVGYSLFGEWPLLGLLRTLLGEERSKQRQLILAFLWTLPIYFTNYRGLPADELSPHVFLPLLVTFLFNFYLFGFTTHWQASRNHAHFVLAGLAESVPDVRREIVERLGVRGIEKLSSKEVSIAEQGVYPLPLSIDVVHTEQIQITDRAARVILRVLDYGNDLYIRWESFYDLSGRRIWLLLGLFYAVINGFFSRLFGTGIGEILERFKDIILPWRGMDTTGAQVRQTASFGGLGGSTTVPSYMLDNLFCLEEVVNESATQVLNEVVLAAGREQKVHLAIERGRGGARSQLF